MSEITRPAPYPADTRAKGWRFEIDMEKVKSSDTWLRAKSGALKGALLLLWSESWQQTPCGSLPDDDELIALLIDMPAATFSKARAVLMRGWSRADDGRLYHETITSRVLVMLEKREADARRTADRRTRIANSKATRSGATEVSRVTPVGHQQDSPVSSPPSTKHQAPEEKNSVPVGTGVAAAPPPSSADRIFALGVPLLTAANVSDRNARSMLGLMRKTHGDAAVADTVQRCAEEQPTEPVAWLQAALKQTTGRASKHAGFASKDYRQGVEEDGTFA